MGAVFDKLLGRELMHDHPLPSGAVGNVSYVHVQSVAATTWVIVHNLGRYPSVTVVDSGNTEVEGDVTYDSQYQVTLHFNAAFSGNAYLN